MAGTTAVATKLPGKINRCLTAWKGTGLAQFILLSQRCKFQTAILDCSERLTRVLHFLHNREHLNLSVILSGNLQIQTYFGICILVSNLITRLNKDSILYIFETFKDALYTYFNVNF